MKYMLLSNSTMPGEAYLDWPKEHIRKFLGEKSLRLLFVPFAGVTISYDEYYKAVENGFQAIGHHVISLHTVANMALEIENCEGIIVGGGNTFQLINLLYKNNLIASIRKKVDSGAPFIGWSAGSNIAGPSIMTTNDMPIVEPPSFAALDFFPWQINPHYTEKTIAGHGGESRSQRIMEFLEVNRERKVIGLPEGMFIQHNNGQTILGGTGEAKLFMWDKKPVELTEGDQINRFL